MDEENKNLQTSQATEQPKEEAPLFFNVMPKTKTSGTMVEASLKAEPKVVVTSHTSENFKKYKWYLIIGVIVIVLGPLIYYLAITLGKNAYKEENLLANREGSLKPASQEAPNENENQSALFTTPLEWREKYFTGCGDENICGDKADPDRDGLNNSEESQAATDPNNADSDQDGLADGDETKVFMSNPLNAHTANDQKYTDADYFKGGYDLATGQKMDVNKIQILSGLMKKFNLHQPTLKALGDVLNSIYNFSDTDKSKPQASSSPVTLASSSPLGGVDMSVEAKQDRDAQRTNTIKNIESALVRYYADNHIYPQNADFNGMYNKVKPYLRVATNPADPINKDVYIYQYSSTDAGADFTLSFFSETANQVIKKHATEAQKDTNLAQAAIYDGQRKDDLDSLRTALLLYSQNNVAGNQTYVFPAIDKYKTALVPDYIGQIPKDPKTASDYEYQVSETFDTFTLKAVFDAPAAGTTGYLCNQEECRNY